MKRFLLTLFLFTIALQAGAKEYFYVSWEDICPAKYQNIKAGAKYFLWSKKYWANRKKMFNIRVEECMILSGEECDTCFVQLKEIELENNKVYEREIYLRTLNRAINKYNW